MGKKIKYKNLAILKLSKIVHLLGKILGLVIKEQEGNYFFNKIEKIRLLSKTSRGKKDKKKIRYCCIVREEFAARKPVLF